MRFWEEWSAQRDLNALSQGSKKFVKQKISETIIFSNVLKHQTLHAHLQRSMIMDMKRVSAIARLECTWQSIWVYNYKISRISQQITLSNCRQVF